MFRKWKVRVEKLNSGLTLKKLTKNATKNVNLEWESELWRLKVLSGSRCQSLFFGSRELESENKNIFTRSRKSESKYIFTQSREIEPKSKNVLTRSRVSESKLEICLEVTVDPILLRLCISVNNVTPQ